MNWTNKVIICKKVPYNTDDFVAICIDRWTREAAAEYFGCAQKTLGLVLKEQIPELKPSTAPLGKRLLTLLGKKKCSMCSEIKAPEDFDLDKYKKDGRTSKCKLCRQAEYKVYRGENPAKIAANSAKRRAYRLERTPAWADEEKIKEVYKNCPEGYHVDHIIPLQGKTVSGLHVAENLQYLTPEENLRKSNKYEEE